MNKTSQAWVYRTVAICLVGWVVLAGSVAESAKVPLVLVMLAIAWADAAARNSEDSPESMRGLLKALFSPVVLPVYLALGGAMLLGLKGRNQGGIDNFSSPSVATAQSGSVPMCGAGHSCGTSGGAACGCGPSGYDVGGEAEKGKLPVVPPSLPGLPNPASGQRSAGRSLPGVGSKAEPLPFNPKTKLHSPLQPGTESIAPKGAAPSVPGLSGKG